MLDYGQIEKEGKYKNIMKEQLIIDSERRQKSKIVLLLKYLVYS